jgi:hypothetical protein
MESRLTMHIEFRVLMLALGTTLMPIGAAPRGPSHLKLTEEAAIKAAPREGLGPRKGLLLDY